jgi:hypothetical protein
MAAQITVRRPDDDHVEILVNGKVVATANHDEHGWSGMDAVVSTACAVARALGGQVDGDHDEDECGACDCATEAPRDPDDPGAYPGPDEDCECPCHEDAPPVDGEQLVEMPHGLDPGQVC